MPQCSECDVTFSSLRSLKRHWNDEHSGELWPDEDDLGPPDSEQRDFDGNEPDDSGHDPEYEVTNDPDSGEKTRLGDNDE